MKCYVMDYSNRKTEFELDLEKVLIMDVEVVTGDEIVRVLYKDGTKVILDGSNCRTGDFRDGEYEVINRLTGHDEFEEWNKRKSVYGYLYGEYDDEEVDEE